MTPEELARHEEWHRTHKPDPRSDQEQGRRDREARRPIDQLLWDDEPGGRAAAEDLGVIPDVFG